MYQTLENPGLPAAQAAVSQNQMRNIPKQTHKTPKQFLARNIPKQPNPKHRETETSRTRNIPKQPNPKHPRCETVPGRNSFVSRCVCSAPRNVPRLRNSPKQKLFRFSLCLCRTCFSQPSPGPELPVVHSVDSASSASPAS